MGNLKAVVLTGGFATRLRPLTLTRPKALLPVLGKPLLDWIIESLRESGIDEVILSVRYLADMIKERYGDGSSWGVKIFYAEEVKPLGDAGPIPLINEKYGIDGTFVVIYGDIFSNVDISKVINYHKSKGGLGTMVLTRVEDPSRYGVAVIDDDGKLRDFIEKPPKEKAISNLINAGIYVFEPEVLKYFPEKAPMKFSKDIIPRLVNEGVLFGYVHEGIWSDIGVPRDYMKANFDALRFFYPGGYVSKSADIDDIEIEQPVFIGDEAVIEAGSKVGPYAVIGRKCRLGANSRIKHSVLLDSVIIEGSTYVSGSVIGRGTYIGKWVRICAGTVLGDDVVISDEVLITKNVVILPYKEIDKDITKEGAVIL